MPRVMFTEAFDWRPRPGVIVAYRAGWSGSVTRRCADKAEAQGKARRLAPRRKETANGTGNHDQG